MCFLRQLSRQPNNPLSRRHRQGHLARAQAKVFNARSFTKKQLIDRLDALVKEAG
jgi:hypothetical protein